MNTKSTKIDCFNTVQPITISQAPKQQSNAMTTLIEPALDDVFTAASVQVSDHEAESIATEYFGLTGTAKLLVGERDLNFHFICSDKSEYLIKISNPAENPAIADFQNKAMLHIEHTDPTLPVQRIHVNRTGTYQIPVELGGKKVLIRLFSFVDGIPLSRVVNPSPQLRSSLGQHLARLGIALRGFFHPAAGHEFLWDITHSTKLHDLVVHISDTDDRNLALHFLRNFEVHAYPKLKKLRSQVIHNDLNFHNVIVNEDEPHEIRNLLDFGDIVYAPLINDLAVAASYQLGRTPNLLEPALEFISAYHGVCPLEKIEQDILFDLIAARLVMTAIITNWRASLYPENRAYILRNAPSAWNALRELKQISREAAQARIHSICL